MTRLSAQTGLSREVLPFTVGRYLLQSRLAAGGMASVYVGQLAGTAGFSRVVAIKRLHQQYALEPEFVRRFIDEAQLSALIHHSNVVQTIDVVRMEGELLLVLEYVDGETLSTLIREVRSRGELLPLDIASAIVGGALRGLHAAHETRGDDGKALHIVHRDVSPQNVMIGRDGVARVLDFGIAKASLRSEVTRGGALKGKCGYMAPEQARCEAVDRRTDVFAAGVVLWEALAGRKLFEHPDLENAAILRNVTAMPIPPPSEQRPEVPSELDRVVLRALDRDPSRRYATANDFQLALEKALPAASSWAVGQYLERTCAASLESRARLIAQMREQRPEAAAELDVEPDAITGTASEPHAAMADGTRRSQHATRREQLFFAWALGLFTATLLLAWVLHPESQEQETASPAPRLESVAPAPRALDHAASTDPGKGLTDPAPSPARALPSSPAPPQTEPAPTERKASATSQPAAAARTKPVAPKPSFRPAAGPGTGRSDPCDPPSYLGADGIRHFKEECL